MSKKITDAMKEKLTKQFSEYGLHMDDALGQLVAGIDRPAGRLVKAQEYKECHNKITYWNDTMVEKFGRTWTEDHASLEYSKAELLKLNLLRNQLFREKNQEFEDMKQTWEKILESFLVDRWGVPLKDALGYVYIYGSGNSALVLLESMRLHVNKSYAGQSMKLYRPMVSITSLNQGSQ